MSYNLQQQIIQWRSLILKLCRFFLLCRPDMESTEGGCPPPTRTGEWLPAERLHFPQSGSALALHYTHSGEINPAKDTHSSCLFFISRKLCALVKGENSYFYDNIFSKKNFSWFCLRSFYPQFHLFNFKTWKFWASIIYCTSYSET
jgi:hypothetical protein